MTRDANDVYREGGPDAVRGMQDDAKPFNGTDPNLDADTDAGGRITAVDFWAYMPMHNYIFAPARAHWPAASVNARLPSIPLIDSAGNPVLDDKGRQKKIPASAWLDSHKPVEQMSWAPGEPIIISDRLIAEGGWVTRRGVHCFNLYREPTLAMGDARRATIWLDHVRRVYPEDAEHIFDWLAHRVQFPAAKLNHALVLGGEQGIGKDTLIEPVKRAVGPWNTLEVSPRVIVDSPFNSYLKAVILRISEARDLGDFDRFGFYDHMKAIIAAPPDVLRINEKHLREYYIPNVVGVIITTNHKTDGIHLPADDRRHYVAWSSCRRTDFAADYWVRLWRFYDAENGDQHVAAYLAQRSLAGFNPSAPPPQTPAFWDVVNASRAPEDAETSDLIERLGNPEIVTLTNMIDEASASTVLNGFGEWLADRKNRRVIPHRLEAAGYVAIHNPYAKDGLWKINGRRQVIYGLAEKTQAQRLDAAARKQAGK